MSLVSNISDVVTSISTKIKETRTWINGNAADLSGLNTTAKSNLVAAINEVKASVASAAGINDETTATSSTWSSSKTSSEIATASTGDRSRANHTGTQSADTLTNGTTNKVFTAAEQTKLGGVASGATANATDAALRARSSHTGTQTADTISDLDAAVDARIALTVDGAPEALDTLRELSAALDDDPNFAGSVSTALGNRVRVDAAQTLNSTQQGVARSNIAAASAADLSTLATNVGNTATDFVATFNAGLV